MRYVGPRTIADFAVTLAVYVHGLLATALGWIRRQVLR